MPKAFDISNQSTKNLSKSPLMDPGAQDAEFAAKGAVGAAIGAVGDVIGDGAMQIQMHTNKGDMAELEGKRIELDANINVMMQELAAEPDRWEEERKTLTDAYLADREDALKGKAPVVQQADALAWKDFQKNTDANFKVGWSKAKISQANSQIEGLAQQKLRMGDYDGFKKEMMRDLKL